VDKSLLEHDNEITIEESKLGSTSKLTALYQTQASKLFQLIKNTEEIVRKFDVLDGEDCHNLLRNLEYIYDIVHKFNMNIQKRFELFEKIDLKTYHDKVPILLKHEIMSLESYFLFLNNLYKQGKEGIDKEESTGKIIDFSKKVLQEFSSNYDKMLQLASKLNSGGNSEKYGNIELIEAIEEMKRILVSISLIISQSVLRTLLHMHKADLKPHVKTLTPILIDCIVCDQLEFNLRLKEVLKKMFKLLVDE
jgi:hypothetical protein